MNGEPYSSSLPKAPTGINGLDEISGGGLPRGRTTIVCGGPGCGKTMLGMEFLIRGAQEFNEPGVLVAFEETPQEMERNVASLGFDLKKLVDRKKLFLDYVYVEPSEIQETGDYDLEGLFIRLQHAVDTVGAKRICTEHLDGKYELDVIDLIKNPQLAQGDQILAIPTLVRNLPVAIRKIIGDLSNVDRVLVGLDLHGTEHGSKRKSPSSEKAIGAKL